MSVSARITSKGRIILPGARLSNDDIARAVHDGRAGRAKALLRRPSGQEE